MLQKVYYTNDSHKPKHGQHTETKKTYYRQKFGGYEQGAKFHFVRRPIYDTNFFGKKMNNLFLLQGVNLIKTIIKVSVLRPGFLVVKMV